MTSQRVPSDSLSYYRQLRSIEDGIPIFDQVEFVLPVDKSRVDVFLLTGSRAYGTNREDSDWDFRGVYTHPTRDLLGIHETKRQNLGRTHPQRNTDVLMFEVGNFIRMALNANPNVLEILYCPQAGIQPSEMGQTLINCKFRFLSKRVGRTYGGYATREYQTWKKLQLTSHSNYLDGIKRLKHTFRLLDQGIQILDDGDLDIFWYNGQWANNELPNLTVEEIDKLFVERLSEFNRATDNSALPNEPNTGDWNKLLQSWRLQPINLQ
jgi:predicted nucleotidyltransferase